MSDEEAISCATTLCLELGIVHISRKSVGFDLFETSEYAVTFPGHSLVDISEVFNKLWYGHHAELGLKAHILASGLFSSQAVKFDSFWSLLFELPISSVEQINELICILTTKFDVLERFL